MPDVTRALSNNPSSPAEETHAGLRSLGVGVEGLVEGHDLSSVCTVQQEGGAADWSPGHRRGHGAFGTVQLRKPTHQLDLVQPNCQALAGPRRAQIRFFVLPQ